MSQFRKLSRLIECNSCVGASIPERIGDTTALQLSQLGRLLARAELVERADEDATRRKTGRKHAASDADAASLFDLLIDNVKDYAIFILDPTGRVVTWNAGVERLLGYRQDEFIGLEFRRLFRSDEQDAAVRELETAAAHGRSDDERWHVRKDGTELWVDGVLTALRDAEGRHRGYAKIMRDTTAQKRAAADREELLRRELTARAAADRANQLKDEFLAIVSHELRTPLNAILGWARMLANQQVPEQQSRHAIEIIERNARAQAQLVEDLLDVSRIVTGNLHLEVRPIAIDDVMAAAIESVAHAAEEKHIAISFNGDANVAVVQADASRIQQVIWNLLTNAIKFTPVGGAISIRREQHGDDLELEVRDNGEGIDPALLPHIFDRFRQSAKARTKAPTGLGLGLAIAHHIVAAHGGTLEARSSGPGTGATFIVHLPLATGVISSVAPTSETIANVDCPPVLDGRRALVVEDQPDSRELLELVLSGCGLHLVSVDSVAAALKALDDQTFDVIISDIGLAGLHDGFALMRSIRAREPRRGGRVPAIALTAYASAADRTRALAAGYQAHVGKPFDPAELVATVASLLTIGTAPADEATLRSRE